MSIVLNIITVMTIKIVSITRISSAININSTDIFFKLYTLNNIAYKHLKGHKEI